MNENKRIAEDVDRRGPLSVRCLEGCLELIWLARLDDDQLYFQQSPNLRERRLPSPVLLVRGIDQHRDP